MLVALALATVLGGCTVTANVEVRVRENGSGMVTLTLTADAEAVQAAEAGGGKLEDRVRLGDLAAADWSVGPLRRAGDGSATLVLRKHFESVDEVAGIVAEISGTEGPLRNFRVTRERRFFSTEFGASGAVELGAATTGITADQALVQRLAEQGADVSGIEARLSDELHRSFAVEVDVRLPGATVQHVRVAPGASGRVEATSEVMDWERLALVVSAGVLLASAVVVAVAPWRRRVGRGRTHRPLDRVSVSTGPGVPPARVRPRPGGDRP